MKKLYYVSQSDNSGYDTYDGFICCAESLEEARNMTPYDIDDSKNMIKAWAIDMSSVDAYEIGIANDDVEIGTVLASFNAG